MESNDSTKIPERRSKHQISPASFQEAANDGSDKGCKQTIFFKREKKALSQKLCKLMQRKHPELNNDNNSEDTDHHNNSEDTDHHNNSEDTDHHNNLDSA